MPLLLEMSADKEYFLENATCSPKDISLNSDFNKTKKQASRPTKAPQNYTQNLECLHFYFGCHRVYLYT